MPEGHSIHRIAARFDALMVGERIAVTSPQGRFAQGARILDSRYLERCWAVGKQMFAEFSGGSTLRIHLGLYGAWDFWEHAARNGAGSSDPGAPGPSDSSMGAPRRSRVQRTRAGEAEIVAGAKGSAVMEVDELREGASTAWPPPPVGAVRVRLLTKKACADLRGPTACEVLTPAETTARMQRLGPDPLVDGRSTGRERFLMDAEHRRTAIGTLLMDQAVIAGIGNIYRAEMLFRSGVNPYIPAKELGEGRLSALWDDWCDLLELGVSTGVILTRTDLRGDARRQALENEEDRHYVYGRAGRACRQCGTPISVAEMQGRRVYWCPSCQSMQ